MRTIYIAVLISCLHLNAYAVSQASSYDDAEFEQESISEFDPWEKINRKTFAFNKGMDALIFKPLDTVYKTVTPSKLRSMVNSFLNNLHEPLNIINGIIQLNPSKASTALGRFLVNSTWGVAGLNDVAQYAGLEYMEESLGKTTMRKYGMNPGPYLVLPFFGPSSVRDTIGLGGDILMDPTTYVFRKNSKLFKRTGKFLKENNRAVQLGVKAINERRQLNDTIEQIEQMSLDEYATMRNLYSQKYR